MRFRLFLLFLPALLAACAKDDSPVRLDFVGATRFTSGNRTASAGDTLTTRAFAESTDADSPLKSLRVTVTYEPTSYPIAYPDPITSYDPTRAPNDAPLVYLDSTLAATRQQLLFQTTFNARTTSGTERWDYTVTDTKGQTATRAYRLVVRNGDSLLLYHRYTIRPTMIDGPHARRYLLARPGLLLPRLAVQSNAENKKLVDLIFAARGANFSVQTPTSDSLRLRWPNPRATELRRTSLNKDAFNGTDTSAELVAAFDGGQAPTPYAQNSGPLSEGNVMAFRTADSKIGLMFISKITRTPVPVIDCDVRIQK